MNDQYIKELYEFAAKIKREGRIGKRKLKISQLQAVDDVVQDLVYDWIKRGRTFATDLDFRKMMYQCMWFSLQECNCKFKKLYTQSRYDENISPERAFSLGLDKNIQITINGVPYGDDTID